MEVFGGWRRFVGSRKFAKVSGGWRRFVKVRRGSWILEVREGPWMEVRGGSGELGSGWKSAEVRGKFVGSTSRSSSRESNASSSGCDIVIEFGETKLSGVGSIRKHSKNAQTCLLRIWLKTCEPGLLWPKRDVLAIKTTAAAAASQRRSATRATRHCSSPKLMSKMILAGLEPAIFGSEDQRLIHWATGPLWEESA